ncbi:MAG: hypothetical protein ACJ76P_09640 [Actinomycetota bacterium]
MSAPPRYTSEITPAGRIAGYTSAACLVVTGAGYLLFSVDEITCSPLYLPCARYAPGGIIIAIGAAFMLFFGVVIGVLVRRRAVSEAGTSGYTVLLSFLFVAGVLGVVARIPTYTCPAGTHVDPLAALCINDRTRFDATSWLLLKWAGAIAAGVIAATIIWRPRWIRVTAPIAAASWFAGLGWLLIETVGRNVKP